MELSPDKEQPADPNAPLQKNIVIPDECGDSLWDAVLEQDEAAPLRDNTDGKDKDLLKDGNSDKQADPPGNPTNQTN